MPMEEEPVVGAMYEDEDGLAFEVLSFDEDEGIVEIQYEDGEVSEIDIDSWYELDLQRLKSTTWKEADEDEADEIVPEKTARRAPAVPEEDDDDVDDYEDEGADDENY